VDDFDQVLALVAAAERRAGTTSASPTASSSVPAEACSATTATPAVFTPPARGALLWRKAALFVDNAGPDVVLGMLPLARLLVKMGAEVR
jgi:hypothetical protein